MCKPSHMNWHLSITEGKHRAVSIPRWEFVLLRMFQIYKVSEPRVHLIVKIMSLYKLSARIIPEPLRPVSVPCGSLEMSTLYKWCPLLNICTTLHNVQVHVSTVISSLLTLCPVLYQTVQCTKEDTPPFPTGVLHSRCVRGPSFCVREPPEQRHTPLHLRHTGPVLLSVAGECPVLQSRGLRQQHADQVLREHTHVI